MKDLTLVKRAPFGAMTVDYYGDGRGNFYMTREQIGRALGYSNPQIAIHKIHRRYKARMDEFSLTKMVNGREVIPICRLPTHSMTRYMKFWKGCGWDICP